MRRALFLLFVAPVLACEASEGRSLEPGGSDAAAPLDGALPDADAAPSDVGAIDGGGLDAGRLDAGPSDAGTLDAGEFDAGTAPTPDAGAEPITVSATFTFSTGDQLEHQGCYFCDATLDGVGGALLRFQMGGGYTIWTLTLPAGTVAGSHTLVPGYEGPNLSLSTSASELSAEARGSYLPPSQSGSLRLGEVDLRAGGVVAGTVDVTLAKPTDASTRVRLQASFRAEL